MNKTNDFKYNLPAYSDPVDIEDLNDNFRSIDDALMAGLCKKDYTGNNMGSSDPSARKYAWAPWFEIVNDNEFDVVVTDRNAPVESEEATINIAAGRTVRKYINGRYYMNFYVQDQHDVTFKWFTNAETYINESGGGGGGTGTVTSVSVQGGSGSHLTGSGNPIETSGTITINVDEGYSIPSDNEQAAWDGKAADLKFEINSSTFVITAQLKDASGNLIGNERTIDLPLETMVVDGEYDSQTQKIKLELKNGNYVEFSVADLVSGLQTELNSNNKLNPAYIDYDSSHRAVSDTEKDTWNGKQNAISDLATIRSGAAAGATAVQPSTMEDALDDKQDTIDGSHKLSSDLVDDTNKTNKFVTSTEKSTWNSKQNALTFDDAPTSGSNNPVKSGGIYTALSGKQDTIDSSHKLSSALVSFSTAQNAALASGIDSSKVGQISTNQTNILYSLQTGANNLCPESQLTIVGNSRTKSLTVNLPAGKYYISCNATLSGSILADGVFKNSTGTAIGTASGFANGANAKSITIADTATEFYFYSTDANATFNNLMIVPEVVWNAIDHNFRTAAISNADLTKLEAEDRAVLAEVVDDGAKNLFDDNNITELERLSQSGNVYTATANDTADKFNLMGYQATPSSVIERSLYIPNINANGVAFGVFTKDPSATLLIIGHSGATINNDIRFDISSLVNGEQYVLAINITQYNPQNTLQFKDVMICTKSKFDISPAYEPHALPNTDLTVLEAEDRAALVEVVDSGAKNIFNIFTAAEVKAETITRTINADGTVTVSNSGTNIYTATLTYRISLVANTQYVISGCPSGGSDNTYSLSIRTTSAQPISDAIDYGSGSGVFTVPTSGEYVVYLRVAPNYAFSDKIFKPMVCAKAAYDVSQKFVPHRVPITGVYAVDINVECSTTETTTGIKFVASEKGNYRITASASFSSTRPLTLRVRQKFSSSGETTYNFLYAESSENTASLSVCGIKSLDVGGVFEVFAKYEQEGTNTFFVLVEKLG